jgi:chorismate synthase
MPGSSFGDALRITTFGESHGRAIGVILDGVSPGLELSEDDIQQQLDRRKPGQSDITTSRRESDKAHIVSGLFQGRTTGTALCIILYNEDARSGDYEAIKDLFRPGHADYTYLKKYGLRDYRGSGRASGRETAARVAAGAVARKLLTHRGVDILAYTLAVGGLTCRRFDPQAIEHNPLRVCDPDLVPEMLRELEQARDEGDSLGGIVECRMNGVPAGLGEPVFHKLDADLAAAVVSLGAVKGIEFGMGFRAARMKGSEHNDQITADGFISNNAGGILGGISTGQEILFRASVKPTSSISLAQKTVDIHGREAEIRTEGRHDPCICPRIVPVVEAMAALVLEDHFIKQAGLQTLS